MADKQTINLDNIKNPEGLRKILEAMYTEVTALRTLANELRASAPATLTAPAVTQKCQSGR